MMSTHIPPGTGPEILICCWNIKWKDTPVMGFGLRVMVVVPSHPGCLRSWSDRTQIWRGYNNILRHPPPRITRTKKETPAWTWPQSFASNCLAISFYYIPIVRCPNATSRHLVAHIRGCAPHRHRTQSRDRQPRSPVSAKESTECKPSNFNPASSSSPVTLFADHL